MPPIEDDDDGFDPTEAFLGSLTDGAGDADSPKKKPVAADKGETPAEHRQDPAEGFEKAAEGETEEDAEADPDDAEVAWKVGEAETKAKLRDLKEAYGVRETARVEGQRAQEVQRAAAERGALAQTALTTLLDRAKERAKPYEEIDFLVLATRVDSDTLAAIRQDAQSALNDVQFLSKELDGVRQQEMQRSQQSRQAAVQESIKVLNDPEKGIKGFGKELYADIVSHAEKTYGAPRDVLLQIVDPWAIKVMHDAMQFNKLQADAAKAKAAAEAKVEKVVNRATKVISGKTGRTPQTGPSSKTDALKALRDNPGDSDAVTDAFLASFG